MNREIELIRKLQSYGLSVFVDGSTVGYENPETHLRWWYEFKEGHAGSDLRTLVHYIETEIDRLGAWRHYARALVDQNFYEECPSVETYLEAAIKAMEVGR